MTGDLHKPRCDWLQQARIEISSNTIIFHDETFVKMVTVEDIINRLSEERQRCYRAHSGTETRQQEPSPHKCHTCRTLQWDNRLIWSLEDLLAWVRANHMDQHEIRDHIDLVLGEYRNELEARREKHNAPSELAVDAIISDLSQRSCLGKCWEKIDLETRSGIREVWREKISQQIGAVAFAIKQEKYFAMEQAALEKQSVEQCKNCRLAGSRACMYHGYPESEIPYSCSYKIGENAIEALHNLDGTFIDVWTVEGHRSKIEAAEARGREDERNRLLSKIEKWRDCASHKMDSPESLHFRDVLFFWKDEWKFLDSLRIASPTLGNLQERETKDGFK